MCGAGRGKFRQTDQNIGIDWYRVPAELTAMLDEVRYWMTHKTFPPDEIAIRFHHRLVAIHPFPNGNGRHARLMADLMIERLGGKPFSWGGGSLHNIGELRAASVAALRAADNHNIGPLVFFARM
jgi:Fic-DOC domain mobile mystery protein B